MALIETLLEGFTQSITENVTYAIPTRATFVHSTDVLEESLDNSTFVRNTATTTGTHVVSPFVRVTTSTTCIVLVQRVA